MSTEGATKPETAVIIARPPTRNNFSKTFSEGIMLSELTF